MSQNFYFMNKGVMFGGLLWRQKAREFHREQGHVCDGLSTSTGVEMPRCQELLEVDRHNSAWAVPLACLLPCVYTYTVPTGAYAIPGALMREPF